MLATCAFSTTVNERYRPLSFVGLPAALLLYLLHQSQHEGRLVIEDHMDRGHCQLDIGKSHSFVSKSPSPLDIVYTTHVSDHKIRG